MKPLDLLDLLTATLWLFFCGFLAFLFHLDRVGMVLFVGGGVLSLWVVIPLRQEAMQQKKIEEQRSAEQCSQEERGVR